MKKNKKTNPHEGSDFNDFLREEGMYEEVQAGAAKKVLAWQMEEAMTIRHMTKSELAARMRTSRAAVNRLLNPANQSINLQTMEKAAAALGKKLSIALVEDC